MRPDVVTVNADMGIAEFRAKFPPGSKTQVIAADEAGRYAGLVLVADAHAPDIDTRKTLRSILHHQLVVLHPGMNIREAISAFDVAEAESLAVVETGDNRPIGILTEAHAMRRYAEESERRRREVVGDA
jgi:chloride channel protein, CIC family